MNPQIEERETRSEESQGLPPPSCLPPRTLDWAALLFAMTFPSVMSFIEFVILPGAGEHDPSLRWAFGSGKVVQFLFPIVFVWLFARQRLCPERFNCRGLGRGIGFAALVGGGALLLYFVWLKGSSVMAGTPAKVQGWLTEMDPALATPIGFLSVAVFIAVPHSFLEEYYWRWFVFGGLRRHVPVATAIVVSSLAFMAHHVIVLGVYLPWTAAVPFSLCVAGGGVVWAWLYHKTDSLYAPWISHLLVDLSIMVVGYDMLRRYW
jgi:membrane protease YdiL (CAAX protease family)